MPTDVSAPFPDLDLEEQSIIEVDLGDPLAVITGLVVHFTQDVPESESNFEILNPLLTYGPGAV